MNVPKSGVGPPPEATCVDGLQMRRDVSNKIKIICRVRPFCNQEFPDDSLQVKGNEIEIEDLRNPGNLLNFNFASCYPMESTQSEIFEEDVRPLIERVFEGNDATIFAYGVTGSGKTHTMEGVPEDPGMIPRVADFLFETKQESTISDIQISMSYIEIFKETVYDLLVPREKAQRGLDIRETPDRKVFVANITEKNLYSMDAFERVYNAARRNRSTASTNLNKRSSRSHAILSLNVSIQTPVRPGSSNSLYHTVYGKINLIDLAGSEDNRKTNNKKDRMTESASINKSLFVLGQVVEALNTGSARIPFRDSKMTRILQPALEGTSLGMMIINIAPGRKHLSDTTTTLNFASRSKKIRVRAKKDVVRAPPTPSSSIDDSLSDYERPPTSVTKRPFDRAFSDNTGGFTPRQPVRRIKRTEDIAGKAYRRTPTSSTGARQSSQTSLRSNAEDDLVTISRKELEELVDRRIKEILSQHPLVNSKHGI